MYSPCDGRPTGMATSSTAYIDIPLRVASFHFDVLGDLDSRGLTYTPSGAAKLTLTENFTYDGLNRVLSASLGGTKTMDVTYSTNGNIQSKTGIGAYTYDTAHLHAVKTANGVTYSYDANGNMTASTAGLTATWTQFNQPLKIQKGSSNSQFAYGANEERVTETTEKGKTVYVGSLYEWTNVSGTAEDHYYIMTPTGRTAVVSRKLGVLSTTYFHADHLGSIDLETDQLGRVAQRYSYDAWGAPRAINWSTGVIVPVHPTSTRGFSDHEMLDGLGLIHMNGRVYDPVLGRFLRADPKVQHPDDSQSYNRYSYVDNNPLSLVDPTGYDASYSNDDLGGFDALFSDFSSQLSNVSFDSFATSVYGSSFGSGLEGNGSLSTTSGYSILQGTVSDTAYNPGAINSTPLNDNITFQTTTLSIARGLAGGSAFAPNSRPGLAFEDDAIRKDYETARAYLIKEPKAKAIIDYLESGQGGHVLKLWHGKENNMENRTAYYGIGAEATSPPDEAALVWNPREALQFTNSNGSGGSISPAIALLHEMGHAAHNFEDPASYSWAGSSWNPSNWIEFTYTNMEERRTIVNVENVAARALGEDIREYHGGIPYVTDSPLSRTNIMPYNTSQ